MKTNDLTLFLQETLQRLFTKSPKYFVVIQYLSLIAMFITGLPELLQQLGVVLPSYLAFLASPAVIKIAGIILFISKLPTQSKPELQSDGTITKTTDAVALPYTAKKEVLLVVAPTDPPKPDPEPDPTSPPLP